MLNSNGRRSFLRELGVAAAGLGIGTLVPGTLLRILLADQQNPAASALNSPMPKRPLGKTGFDVSLLALGGRGVIAEEADDSSDAAERIIHRALDLGVNYIDTSPRYGNGLSEARIGAVLKSRRNDVFLASKTHDRSYDGTLRLVEQSLKRLCTDRIDLYQLDDVTLHEELDTAGSRNGALRAMKRLQAEGTVRFLGITGDRDPDVLLRAVKEYPFDAILMPLNAADIHYRPFQEALLQTALSQEIGVIAMRVTAMSRLLRYEGVTSMEDAMNYVYSFAVSTAVVGVSQLRQLEKNVAIAKRFSRPYNAEQIAAIEALTEPYKSDANWFKS